MTDQQTKTFHVGDVLSAMTGTLVSPTMMTGVDQIMDYLTGESLFTHQLVRAFAKVARQTFEDANVEERARADKAEKKLVDLRRRADDLADTIERACNLDDVMCPARTCRCPRSRCASSRRAVRHER